MVSGGVVIISEYVTQLHKTFAAVQLHLAEQSEASPCLSNTQIGAMMKP
jgi:hypothetical protein